MKRHDADAAGFELSFQVTNEAGSEAGPLEHWIDRHRAEAAAREVEQHTPDHAPAFRGDQVQRRVFADA
jgi:hypothetical protein